MEVTGIVDKLRSSDLDAQAKALDGVRELIAFLTNEAAAALATTSGRYPVAEKLFSIGPAMIPALEELLGRGGDPEVLTYAALVLMNLGSLAGSRQLLCSLRDGIGPIGMIANTLSRHPVDGASSAIGDALMRWNIKKDPYMAATLVSALRRLNAAVPDVNWQRCILQPGGFKLRPLTLSPRRKMKPSRRRQ